MKTAYEPLDLRAFHNSGTACFDTSLGDRISLGLQQLRGIPFCIGSPDGDSEHSLLLFDGSGKATERIRIPVERRPRHVIFAHSLLEPDRLQGDNIGGIIAEYVFSFEDNREVRIPVRKRFEIGCVPVGWGQLPFVALPDEKDGLQPRLEGRWGKAGHRQTEVEPAWPGAFYLWAWRNPWPHQDLRAVSIRPADSKFVIGGITLGFLEEAPFHRTARKPVKITLTEEADAVRPFDLEVEVDRGVATYVFPLPKPAAAGNEGDSRVGWGEPTNELSSPAYVEIAATASATMEVKQGGESLGTVNWGRLNEEGSASTPRLDLRIVETGKNWVHTTVVDDETGSPIPCRIHFRSPQGIPYQPHGHHDRVNSNHGSWHTDIGGDLRLGQITYAYIEGTCQGWLPLGDVVVDAARGFEYEPLRTCVKIKPGQRKLEIRLKRWTHMNARRWFSGDTHVHFLGERGGHREAAGEDLNVVNLLASQWGHLFTNAEDFVGRPTVSHNGETIVYTSQENRQHLLGHLSLLGLKEHVSPWCSDGPSEAGIGDNLEITLSRWADACHEQGGTVVIPHLPNPNGEPAALIATERADAVEMLVHDTYNHSEYYKYLNCGYRLPLVGGTDKMTADVPVGICRTYVHIPADELFDYESWCRWLGRGRTFLSSGPLLFFNVAGAEIGDTVRLPGNGGSVEVEAHAQSIFPIHTLQIVQEGRVVASTEEAKGSRSLHLRATLTIEKHSWLAARCAGPNYEAQAHFDGWRRGIFAHTSPVYIAVGGEWWMFDAEVARYMLTLIDGSVQYIRHIALQHDHQVQHHHDFSDHREYLEEPFHEAAQALHKRMHDLGIAH